MRLVWLVACAVGCSASGLGTDAPDLAPAPPGAPFSVYIGPIPVAAGGETTRCITIRLPTQTDSDIVRLEATLAPGSHHLILYKSSAFQEAATPIDCTPFAGVTSGETPIFIAETEHSVLSLPTGVSWHLPAGQMVKLEAHYLNAGTQPLQGLGAITLTPGSPGAAYQPADVMFCGSLAPLMDPGVPPDVTDFALPPASFFGGGGTSLQAMKLFGFTSHEHHLGSRVTIAKTTSPGDPGTVLYDNTSWDHPPLATLDDAHLVSFAAGEGLRWQCRYDSADAIPKPTGTTRFGLSALDDEMCFVWAYYFPSAGHFVSTECWR